MSDDPLYKDPSAPITTRVEDLLDRMTLEEKLAQLHAAHSSTLLDESANAPALDSSECKAIDNGIGHITRIGGEAKLEPTDAAHFANRIQTYLREETRLGIPAIMHEECLIGFMGPGGSTFPHSIGLASSFDPSLTEEMTGHIQSQLTAIGCHHALSPVLDLGLDPRFGRIEETYGEDPYLVASMARGFIEGLEETPPADGISATVKHFVGHGAPEGGRGRAPLNIGERELKETHRFPFEAVIHASDPDGVMNAYHDIDGIPCTGDSDLLTDQLRGELGFDGVVVSDYHSVRRLKDRHRVASSKTQAGVQALEAGIDIELPGQECYGPPLSDAIEAGNLHESTVDRSVRRILRQKFEHGLFEDPFVDPGGVESVYETDEQRSFARKAARRSIVLSKNEEETLPLEEDIEELAVVGPKADSERGVLGDYAFNALHDDEPILYDIVTPLAGLEAGLDASTTITYEEGCQPLQGTAADREAAVEAVESADIGVVCLGEMSQIHTDETILDPETADPQASTSGEGNHSLDIQLPPIQRTLFEELAETETPLVVVLLSGRPLAIESIVEQAESIVHAWLPGEEAGNGLADVLVGDHNPSGRLPVSIPKSVGQLPVHYSRKETSIDRVYTFGDADPRYAFGHGESYTDFTYHSCELNPASIGVAGTTTVSVTLENTGDRAGREVIQLYVRDKQAERARPTKELVAFESINLAAGESATVSFDLCAHQLGYYDRSNTYIVEPGVFDLQVGHASDDIRLRERLVITGDRRAVPDQQQYFTPVSIDRSQ